MKFTDELRSIANEPIKSSKRQLNKKAQEEADRKETISRGRLTSDFYEAMKKQLLEEVKSEKIFEKLRGKVDNDNHHSFEIVYKPDEFKKKDSEYQDKYQNAETEYDYITGEKVPIRRSTKIRAYIDYYVLHKVFSKNECELLKWQLSRKLKEDGFYFNFSTKEFKRKICDGLGLCVPTVSYGYELNLTVWWD